MAWLPAMPPVIKFVSRLVNKVHVQVLHKPGADLGGWMGSLSKISLASSLQVSQVTQICGLCSLPQAAQITPLVPSCAPPGPMNSSVGPGSGIISPFAEGWILHGSHKVLRGPRPQIP